MLVVEDIIDDDDSPPPSPVGGIYAILGLLPLGRRSCLDPPNVPAKLVRVGDCKV